MAGKTSKTLSVRRLWHSIVDNRRGVHCKLKNRGHQSYATNVKIALRSGPFKRPVIHSRL